MKISDSVVLAYTKYRTRKARSILVVFGSACITALVLFFSIATAGLQRSVVNKASPIGAMNLLKITDYMATSSTNPSATNEKYWEDLRQRTGIQAEDVKAVFYETEIRQMNSSTLSLFDGANPGDGWDAFLNYRRTLIKSKELIQPYIPQDTDLSYKAGDPLPIVVSADIIETQHKDELAKIKDVVKRVERSRELQKQYIGRSQKLKIEVTPPLDLSSQQVQQIDASDNKVVEIDVKIVGFSPSTNGFFSGLINQDGPTIVIEYEAAKAHPELAAYVQTATSAYASFYEKEARTAVVEKYAGNYDLSVLVYGDIAGSTNDLLKTVSKVLRWVIVVMLLFVTLPMMSTMSKILADSQRETGVFRAIGARNSEIVQIYVVYSTLLALVAFVIAVLISSIIALLLTLKYGDILGAQLSEVTGSTTISSVSLYGVQPLHWLVLLVILVLASALGTAGPVSRTLRKDPILAMRDE
jgi:hypothetical protein